MLAILFLPSIMTYIFFGLFIFMGCYLMNTYLKNEPSVIVSKSGIRSSVNGVGTISWKFIAGFDIVSGINFEALVILLKDQETFFQDKNSIVKNLMKSNTRRFGSPAVIPETEFHVSLPEAIEMIEKYRNLN